MNKKIGVILYIILLAAFILLTIDFYLTKKYYQPRIDDMVSNPKLHEGKIAEYAGPVLNVSSDSFYMLINRRPLKVYYANLEKPKLGQVYVQVKLNADGTANGLQVHVLSYNYLKYYVSIFAALLFLFIFFREWKFKKWRFVENA